MRIALVDNNDSFTRNLAHLLAATLGEADIIPYEEFSALGLRREYDLLVISPGPGHPDEYPAYGPVLQTQQTPVLGICMGMQIINRHFGGTVKRLPGCVHGKTDTIVFNGTRQIVARYHSLHCATLGNGLAPLATNDAGIIMALTHTSRPVLGYQFHPESFLTAQPEEFMHYAAHHLSLPT